MDPGDNPPHSNANTIHSSNLESAVKATEISQNPVVAVGGSPKDPSHQTVQNHEKIQVSNDTASP